MSTPNDEKPQDSPSEDVETFSSLEDISEEMRAQIMSMLSSAPVPASEVDVTIYQEEVKIATAAAEAAGAEGPWANLEDLALDANNRNARDIKCPFCRKCVIMLAGAGTFVEKDIFLMHPQSKSHEEGRVYSKFFKLTSKMDFENITVKRQVAGDNFRYLTCGDCELGPIGITFDADNNKVFYVSHDRVLYG